MYKKMKGKNSMACNDVRILSTKKMNVQKGAAYSSRGFRCFWSFASNLACFPVLARLKALLERGRRGDDEVAGAAGGVTGGAAELEASCGWEPRRNSLNSSPGEDDR